MGSPLRLRPLSGSPEGEGRRKGFGKTEAYGEKKDEDGFSKTEAYGEEEKRERRFLIVHNS